MSGSFDFGLGVSQEARAQHLHRSNVVIDMLSQHAGGAIFAHLPPHIQSADFEWGTDNAGLGVMLEAVYTPYELALRGESDLLFDWFTAGGLTCGTYGIDIHDGRDPFQLTYERLVDRYSALPWLTYVTSAREIRAAKQAGRIAFYAHCQPTTAPPMDLSRFEAAYERGLRSFMLTYNTMNGIGVGCTERVDAGLSRFGVDVVNYCNDAGIIVDLSHCGNATTLDACRHSTAPVTANHTASRSLHDHARCKSDDEIRAIADTGGVIGIVAVPAFLTDSRPASIETMLDHIDYVGNLVGLRHVAIGTDWPLQAPEAVLRKLNRSFSNIGFRKEDRLDLCETIAGFNDCRDLTNITRGLVARGYTDCPASAPMAQI
jgi:membrane dipeptidase